MAMAVEDGVMAEEDTLPVVMEVEVEAEEGDNLSVGEVRVVWLRRFSLTDFSSRSRVARSRPSRVGSRTGSFFYRLSINPIAW